MKTMLPVKTDTTLKLECWTYYKLAIIETMPNHMNWLSSHINIYQEYSENMVYYGNCPKPHSPEYFRDILCIEEIDLFTIDPSKILTLIKSNIEKGYYHVIFLRQDINNSHESFIYGYDDITRSFNSFSVTNNTFRECIISYNDVFTGYSNEIEFFQRNPELYYHRRAFGYVMSRIKPSFDYLNKNYAYNYFEKINNEVYGKRIEAYENESINIFSYPKYYHIGISCISFIRNELIKAKNILYKKQELPSTLLISLRNSLFKMLEYRLLLCKSMQWIAAYWNIDEPVLNELCNKYNKCYYDMKLICNLYLKFENKNNLILLQNIIQMIENQYLNEKKCLGEYAILIRQWYLQNITYENS